MQRTENIGSGWQCRLLSSTNIPPTEAEERDEASYANGVVHVCWRYWPDRREEKNNTDKDYPSDSYGVDRFAPLAHRVWAFDKLNPILVDPVSDDDCNVAKV